MNNRQDPVRSAHGLPAMDYFHADRRPVWRRSPGPDAFLRRAIPVHGLRPADLPGKPARHIETCLSVHASKLYHMGFRQPVRRSTLADANERRDWRIHAALAQRLITQGEDAVRRRRTGVGPDQYRLRPGLDDHRSVPVGLSVGALPHHQGGGGCGPTRSTEVSRDLRDSLD